MEKTGKEIQVIAEILPCGVLVVGKDGRITAWNKAAAAITGIEARQALGSMCRDLLACSQDCPLHNGDSQMPIQDRVTRWKTGRSQVNVLCNLQYLRDGKGQIAAMVESFIPAEQAHDFRACNRRRPQAMDVLDNTTEFIAGLGRELQTPLNGIYRLAELLAGSENSQVQAQILVLLKRSAKMLMNLIEEILLLREIEKGNFRPQSVSFDLRELIDAVVNRQRRIWTGSEVRIDKWIASDVPCRLRGDSERLARVLGRLLDNARQASTAASVELRVAVLQFKSGAQDSQENDPQSVVLEFAVEDHGPGLKQEDLSLICRDFKEMDSSYAKSAKFLGLLLSRFLVRNMGGRMWIESGISGTVINFTLPFKVVSLQAQLANCPSSGSAMVVNAA